MIYQQSTYSAGALQSRTVVDTTAATLTVFNGAGAQVSQRALTAPEIAYYATQDTATTAASNQTTLQTRAQAALAANATFLALASPTNAQIVAQVQTLTKECNALVRLLLGQFDSAIGT